MLTRITLIVLVLIGLWGAGNLSYDQYQTGDACPILGNTVPACYVAFAGYSAISLGVVLSLATGSSAGLWAFWTGITIAGGLAAVASVIEAIKGQVCPVAFGSFPTCYFSLGMSMLIAGLFWTIKRV